VGTGDPMGDPYPRGYGYGGKSIPTSVYGWPGGVIFLSWVWVWGSNTRWVFTHCHLYIEHLMRHQMSDKVVADGPTVHPGQSARTQKWILPNLSPSGFFWFYNDLTVRAWGRTVHAWSRTIHSVNLRFCSVPVQGTPWCCGRSAHRSFPNIFSCPK
jgi:hypothetical protein